MRNAAALVSALALFGLLAVAAPAPKEPAKKESPVVGAWIECRELGGDLTIIFTADGKLVFDVGQSPVEGGSYKVHDGGPCPMPCPYGW
jgi:hypothetical protein